MHTPGAKLQTKVLPSQNQATFSYVIAQRVRMNEYPELGGPLYNIVYIMYLVVDGIIVLNWYNDRPTIVNYLDKWKLLNSRTCILPFKRKPVSSF